MHFVQNAILECIAMHSKKKKKKKKDGQDEGNVDHIYFNTEY